MRLPDRQLLIELGELRTAAETARYTAIRHGRLSLADALERVDDAIERVLALMEAEDKVS